MAHGRIVDALDDARDAIVAQRERARGLPEGFADPITLERRNTSSAVRRSGQLLGSLLPYILLTLSVLGGMYAAVDLTAGEKERGTMQTLLVAPIRPSEIVVAKFLAVWLLSMLSLVANLASLSLTVSRLLPANLPGVGAGNLLLAMAVLVPVTLTTSALFLALASFARDFRDGQTMLTPVYMAVALPAGVVALPTIELNAWTAFVPIVNVTLLIKALFLREASTDLVFLTLLSAFVVRRRGNRRRRSRLPPRDRARRRADIDSHGLRTRGGRRRRAQRGICAHGVRGRARDPVLRGTGAAGLAHSLAAGHHPVPADFSCPRSPWWRCLASTGGGRWHSDARR